MPPKQRSTYCDLATYVADKHSDLYAAFDGACIRDILVRGGVTLLVPSKDAQKKLSDDVDSGDAEAVRRAREVLLAHVIHGAHKTITGLLDVNTRQSEPRAVKFNKFGDSIKIASGAGGKTAATAKPAADFVDSSARGNNCVYIIESGEVAADGPVVDIRKPAKPAKTGGYALEPSRSETLRHMETIRMERMLLSGDVQGFLAETRGLAVCIHKCEPSVYFEHILPRLHGTFLDLYIMLQPHKLDMENYDVGDDTIMHWCKEGRHTATVAEFLATTKGQTPNVRIYTDVNGLIGQIAAIRSNIRSKHSVSEIIDAIEAAYAGDVIKAWPSSDNKLALDDLRFWSDIYIRKYAGSDAAALNGVLNRIGDALRGGGNTRFVTNRVHISKIGGNNEATLLDAFVKSAFFLSFVAPSEEQCRLSNNQSVVLNPYDDTFYNPLLQDGAPNPLDDGKPTVNHARVEGGRMRGGCGDM